MSISVTSAEQLPTNVVNATPSVEGTLFQKVRNNAHGGISHLGKFIYRHCCTHEGLIGDVNYKSLFMPSIPFTKFSSQPPQFFPVDADLPSLLTILLGFQHALAMMGGLISMPQMVAGSANLSQSDTEYLVSASLIGSGILTLLQVCRFRIPWTNYYIGTGMISVLGETFTTATIFQSAAPLMYQNGYCPTAADGTKLPCRQAYGALLGTGALCALLQLLLSFVPPRALKKLFPHIVTGPVLLLVGASLVQSGMEDWGGGSNCYPDKMCNTLKMSHAHPWGSGQWVGIGFSVAVAIIITDRFGAPIMKSCSVVIGLLVGCIICAACGYFQHESIDRAPNGEFNWVNTFPLRLYGPIVLPMLAVYIACVMETIGDITASADVSHLPTVGNGFESRVQGGILASGIASIIGCLATLTPLGTFSQNNGVIAMTQVASRRAGIACCVWLVLMGVIGKFSAAIVAIPRPAIGGMTTFLFTSVGVSGLAIISKSNFSRRDRVVLTIELVFGFGSLLVPTWFQGVFTYKGSNSGLKGFLDAIVIIVEAPYAIAGIVGCLANLAIPEQDDDIDLSLATNVSIYEGQDSDVLTDDGEPNQKKNLENEQ